MIIQSMNIMNFCNRLNDNVKKSTDGIHKISSGKRINKAADDAAGLSISESFKAQVRGLSKAQQNTLEGICMIQTADGTLESISDQIIRMKELSVQAANDTLTDDDRKLVNNEFEMVKKSIDEAVDKCEFNTIKLLKEDKVLNIQVGDDPIKYYNFALKKMDITSIGLKDVSLNNAENAQNALGKVDEALSTVISYRCELGNHLNNLKSSIESAGNAEVNITTSLSKIEDVDMATAVMKMIKNNTIKDYSQSMLLGANQRSLAVWELLK